MIRENLSKKCRGTFKLLFMCIIFMAVLMEWLEYALSPMFWPKFPSGLKNSIRILIVGDPQLLGYSYSGPGALGYICRWDADRYVSKTFSHAYHYVVPDIVIFLGDNLDEGEVATNEEFHDYIKRFQYVFHEVDFHKAIIVPGDNDIGGEDEPPSPDLEKRFNKYFRDDVFIPFKYIEFVKVNYITHSNQYLLVPNDTNHVFRIALSHIPLTSLYSTFVSKVIPYLKPHIILSAHDHKSGHWIAKRQTGVSTNIAPQFDVDFFAFNTSESFIHEIMVPTCSYRMGTYKMGYGALELSPNGEAFYTVLWLPSRFRQLVIYLSFVISVSLYFILLSSRACCRYISNQNTNNFNRFHRSHLMM